MCQNESRGLYVMLANLPYAKNLVDFWGSTALLRVPEESGNFWPRPLSLSSPRVLAPWSCRWMAFAYWWLGPRSLASLDWERTGFTHPLWYTWTGYTRIHTTLYRVHQGEGLLILFFHSALQVSNHFHCHRRMTSSLFWMLPLSQQSAVSPLSGFTSPWWRDYLHIQAQTRLVSVWARFGNRCQISPSIYFFFNTMSFLFPQWSSLRLLMSLTLVILIKILYLEKKSRWSLHKMSQFDG